MGDVAEQSAPTMGDFYDPPDPVKSPRTQAPRLEIPEGIGGDFSLYDGA